MIYLYFTLQIWKIRQYSDFLAIKSFAHQCLRTLLKRSLANKKTKQAKQFDPKNMRLSTKQYLNVNNY